MKKSITPIALTFICLMAFLACKKKDEKTTTPAPTNNTPVHVNAMTANVNNANWAMLNNQGILANSISKSGNNYNFTGQTAFSTPYTSIKLAFINTTGVHNFGSVFSNFSAQYKDSSDTYYTAKTGTINITTLDTISPSQGIINKFKASFSFSTDTINNKSYIITNGIVDFEKSN